MKKLFPLLALSAMGAFAQSGDLSADSAPATYQANPDSPAAEADAQLEGLGANLDDQAAQERMLELMQQGKYVRKSLVITPMLFWIGNGADQIRVRHKPVMVGALRDSLKHMARFDINVVPTKVFYGMRDDWSMNGNTLNQGAQREAALSKLVDENLSPALLGPMMGALKERAERNLTEDQLNSFMVDKAKESGITATELNLVLNSGYVVVPVTQYLAYGVDDKGGYEATVKGGLLLYKVRVTKDRIWLEKRASLIRAGQETTDKDGYSLIQRAMMPADQRAMATQELIMYRAIDDMWTAVMQDLRDLPEFRLLAQVTSGEGKVFQAPFAGTEIKDVPQDKFFEQIEQIQAADGSIGEQVTGWGFVNKPVNFKIPVKALDSNVTEYIWEGYMAKGSAQSYSNVREYSRVPVDVDIRLGVGSIGLDVPANDAFFERNGLTSADAFTASGTGLMLQIQSLFAPIANVSQLHARAGFSYKVIGLADGDLTARNRFVNFYGMSAYDVNLGIEKKFWLGQLVPNIGADLRFGEMGVHGDYDLGMFGMTGDIDLYDYYIGARVSAGVEYAINPNLRIGFSGAGIWNAGFGSWSFKDSEGNTSNWNVAEDSGVLSPIGIEAGVYVMINAWPLRKAWDAIMGMTTGGIGGAIRQGSLRPLP